MNQRECLSHNLYTVGTFTQKELAKLYITVSAIIFGVWLITLLQPNIIASTILHDQHCQKDLNFQVLDSVDEDELYDAMNYQNMCFLCVNTLPQNGPFTITSQLSSDFGMTRPNFETIQFSSSLIASNKKIDQDICTEQGMMMTNYKDFPKVFIHQQKTSKDILKLTILQNQRTEKLGWSCDRVNDHWKCSGAQTLIQLNANIDTLLIYQKVTMAQDSKQFVDIKFLINEYNDSYFVYNEIMFIIWIGFELIFILLVFGLKNSEKVANESVLIQTHGKYGRMIIAVVCNNSCFFPIQIINDVNWVRKANTLCSTFALYLMQIYILGTLRKIRGNIRTRILFTILDQVVGIFLLMSILVFQMSIFQIQNQEIIQESQRLFNQLEIQFIVIQVSIALNIAYLSVGMIYTLYEIPFIQDYSIQESIQRKSIIEFILFSSLLMFGCLARLFYQYWINFSTQIIFFDQVQTVQVNLYFFLVWWLFEQEDPEEIELEIQHELVVLPQFHELTSNQSTITISETRKNIQKDIQFDQEAKDEGSYEENKETESELLSD